MPIPSFPERKSNSLPAFCFLVCLISSCFAAEKLAAQENLPFPKKTVHGGLSSDSILNREEFSLFVPSSIPDSGNTPLILFFDPQGDGSAPLKLYADLAAKAGVLIAGSNRCKNGLSGGEALMEGRVFYSQLTTLFPHLRFRIYLAGFSGGAVLASALSRELPEIRGLIYAAAPSIAIPSCPSIGITGMADPNFHEMRSLQERIPENIPHCLRYWNGKHAWPPAESMAFAFDWIQTREGKGEAAIELLRKSRRRCATKSSMAETGEQLELRVFLASSLNVPGDDSLSLAVWKASPAYKKFYSRSILDAKEEQKQKDFYLVAFIRRDPDWWKQETERLRKAGALRLKEQRLLGYLSLLGWSFASRSLNSGNAKDAEKYVELYHMIDPENPEPFFLQAISYARKGNLKAASQSLKKAADLGFADKKRLLAQSEFSVMDLSSIFSD